jgi:2-polyprenyl-6-methoxyphenol hydroxylase-like FAD-dependent oxidoreductase
MFGKKKPDVLIVGAGPAGLFAALVLTKQGIRVQIVDKAWRRGAHSYALALHSHSLRLLETYGLLGPILDTAYRVRTIGLYERAHRRAELRTCSAHGDFSFLAVMPQDVLESLLEDALEQLGVKVLWNHEVRQLVPRGNDVAVTVDKLVKEPMGYAVAHTEWMVAKSIELEVPFVIGADGHQSIVRRSLGIDFVEAGPVQHFAVFEFGSGLDLAHEMRIVMDEHTTNVLWPLPGGRCRWSFQLLNFHAPSDTRLKDRIVIQMDTEQDPVLSEANLDTLIAERAPWFEGNIDLINWRAVVRFERRLARRLGAPRVWLIGDAGHVTGPVGVQSMNVGLREAEHLSKIIASVLGHGASTERLQSYDRQRTTEWRYLLGLEGELGCLEQTDPWVGQRADRLLSCVPASGADLDAMMQQLGLETRPCAGTDSHRRYA